MDFHHRLREWRHSPCLMTPISSIVLLSLIIVTVVSLACRIPTIIVGLLLSPLSSRVTWLVEFLYPNSLARWGHIWLLKYSSSSVNGVKIMSKKKRRTMNKGKKGGKKDAKLDEVEDSPVMLHSRAIEQRTEVVKGRVYIHPIPQLLDNIAYLIVCLPPAPSLEDLYEEENNGGKKSKFFGRRKAKESPKKTKKKTKTPILAIMVDCGDARSALEQMEFIRDVHYHYLPNHPPIELHAVLSTHKHHDHTAGNKALLRHPKVKHTLKHIYGGVIEKVPHVTDLVKNGEFLSLPHVGNNNMNDLVEIECIAVPSHTRGSIVFNLRNKAGVVNTESNDDFEQFKKYGSDGQLSPKMANMSDTVVAYLFAGDAMFSAGAGVPFEADLASNVNIDTNKKTSRSHFQAGGGIVSTERCFSEVLVRALNEDHGIHTVDGRLNATNQMLLFPGHEYTIDLLHRQFDRTQEYYNQWMKNEPATFFEFASHFFVMNHRRNLPKITKLLTVPSSIRREMKINPYFRNVRKRGEHVLKAVSVWYKLGKRKESIRPAKGKGKDTKEGTKYIEMPPLPDPFSPSSTISEKTPSSDNTWTTNHVDVNKSVFTTVYSTDLDDVIYALKSGSMAPEKAAKRLSKLTKKLEEPPILRRPIPGTLPNEKTMYLGLIAFAVLGAAPSALTLSDSIAMDLPEPVKSSDYLLISKKRIIAALRRLDLLPPHEFDPNGENELLQMINLLWKEVKGTSQDLNEETGMVDSSYDLVELGILKLTLYSISYNQQSWFSKYCLPCSSQPELAPVYDPRTKKLIKRSGGELVRHDATKCIMCSDIVGGPISVNDAPSDSEEEEDSRSDGEGSIHMPQLLPNGSDVEMKYIQKSPLHA